MPLPSIPVQPLLPLRQRRQQIRHRRIVSERCAQVCKEIHIAGSKDEAPSKLKRIPAEFVLLMTARLRSHTGSAVVGAQHMKYGSILQSNRVVSNFVFVDQQRKSDAGVFAEDASVSHVAEADGGNPCSLELESFFAFAQLRDMLTAENSTVMPKKGHHAGLGCPQRTQPNLLAFRVG